MRSAEVRLRQAGLVESCEAVRARMQALVDEFASAFRKPWPIHLVLQDRPPYRTVPPCRTLRWRLPGRDGRGQSMIVLVRSEKGLAVLNGLPAAVRRLFLEFDRRAAVLNLEHELLRLELRELEQFSAYLRDWRDAGRRPAVEADAASGKPVTVRI